MTTDDTHKIEQELSELYENASEEPSDGTPLDIEGYAADPSLMTLCESYFDGAAQEATADEGKKAVGGKSAPARQEPVIDVTLTPLELQTLETVLRELKKKNILPLEKQENLQPWLILAQNKAKFPYLAVIAEKLPRFRDTKEHHFYLPEGFSDTKFEGFELLCEGHRQAWALLTIFGPKPETGLYMYGKIGSGKTHLVAAFSRGLRAKLLDNSRERIAKFATQTIVAYENYRTTKPNMIKGEAGERNTKGIVMYYAKQAGEEFPFQPSDLAFMVFDKLYERREDTKLVDDFIKRRIVILDDIHHKGERYRMEFIQKIIEERYNEVRSGATFMTSNISQEALLVTPEYPKEVAERVHSRLVEMSLPIYFDPPKDYRLIIAERRNQRILEMASQLAAQQEEKRGK